MNCSDGPDISAGRRELALDEVGFHIWESDLLTGAITRVPYALAVQLGYRAEDAPNSVHHARSIVHPDDLAQLAKAMRAHRRGAAYGRLCEFRLRDRNGSWIWYAMHGRVVAANGDAGAQRLVGVIFCIQAQKQKDARQEALTRALKLLNECGSVLIRSDNESAFLQAVCRLAVETGGYLMAWVGFAEHDPERSVSCSAQSGYEDGYLDGIKVTWSDADTGQGPIGTAIKTGSTVVNNDYQANPNMAPWRDAATARGYRSSIALPLLLDGRPFGVFSIYAADACAFSATEVVLLEELASNIAYGVQALRTRVEREQAGIALKKENEKNLALLRGASDGIHILDAEGYVVEASDSFCAMLDYPRSEVIGMHVSRWDAVHARGELLRLIRQQLDNPSRTQFETRHRRRDGSVLEVEISGFAIELGGRPVLFNSSRDVTDRKRAEQRLREQQRQLVKNERQYRELLRNLRTGIVVHRPDTSIAFSNPRAAALLGSTEDQLRGRTAAERDWEFIDDREQVLPCADYPVNRVIASLKPIEGQVLGIRRAASTVWLLVNAFPEFDADGRLKQVVVNFDDITARKEAEEQIHSLAFFDALSGLPNRRLFMDRLNSALSLSARSGRFGALLFIDLDKFKTVNDVLGHDLGDLLLVEVAARITSCVRDADTVARLGGDEFVVILVDLDEQQEIASQKTAHVAEKIRACLAMPYQLKGTERHSSSSIGAAVFRGTGESPDVLLRQADIAMYKAKDAGRNAIRFFNPEMQRAVEAHAAIEGELHHAIARGQLRLYYQVQVDSDLRAVGAEALIRWQHPERGLVSPLQFIPIAEESSLIVDIGNWVLETACRQLAEWARAEATRHLTLSVNVSARQFRQPDFVENLGALLRRYRIAPFRLKLELTESVVLNDVEAVAAMMHALKGLGVGLSMDDFGTGYSSLSYLKQLPLDQIKIDQSFVRDITADVNDAVMVKTIIDLARNFRLHVIAEGVETESQFSFLKRNDCMAYQGYLFGHPLPLDAFDVLLNRSLPQ